MNIEGEKSSPESEDYDNGNLISEGEESETMQNEPSISQNMFEATQESSTPESDDDNKAFDDFFGPSPQKKKKKTTDEEGQRFVAERSMRPRQNHDFSGLQYVC